jgi:hypothetical protein
VLSEGTRSLQANKALANREVQISRYLYRLAAKTIIIDNGVDARYDFEGYKIEIDIIFFGGL